MPSTMPPADRHIDVETSIVTPRLRLRSWKPSDLEPFAALNADPRVMKFFPGVLTREATDALVSRIARHFEQYGYGLWAVEVAGGASFIGLLGLSVPTFTAPFTPCVEIGWRLAADQWGRGYATEGGRAVLSWAFETLNLAEVVSFTVTDNWRSRRVMERLGLTYDPADDFDHPAFPPGHRLRRHVLYRARRADRSMVR